VYQWLRFPTVGDVFILKGVSASKHEVRLWTSQHWIHASVLWWDGRQIQSWLLWRSYPRKTSM